MKRYTRIFAALALALPLTASAHTQQRIFAPEFKTLKVGVADDFMSPPSIQLGGNRQICVSFDEMGSTNSYLRYSLTHCDADWQPSPLLESDVLDSFNEAEITDYASSAGVFRSYVNYRVCLPNADMAPLLSGNYLMRVWREDDPDTTVLQARFTISEQAVRVTGAASSITDRGSNSSWQQLNFSIDLGHYNITNPYSELIIKVYQNGIDVTPAGGLRPLRSEGQRLVYEHNPGLIFPAGNEFRRFETVRTDYAGMHVAENRYENYGYTAILTEDTERASRPYTYDRTQYGRFKVDEYSASDPDLGADYLQTTFTLDFPQLTNGDIILDGEFVRSLPYPDRVMHYDPATGKYTKTLLLKQGSYNYRYAATTRPAANHPSSDNPSADNPSGVGAFADHSTDHPSGAGALADPVIVPSVVEGDKYETCNEYTICVYHRAPGARYDRLLCTATIAP